MKGSWPPWRGELGMQLKIYGTSTLLKRLDTVFKYDAITELPHDFENFFMHTRRSRNQTIQEYTADFEQAFQKLEAHATFRPSGATNHWKNTVFCDCSTFSCTCIFFLLTLSLL
jgi:hypothetical protein